MLHCWWNVSELRPHSQKNTTLLLTNHVQMGLVCLEALLINYVQGVALYVPECAFFF